MTAPASTDIKPHSPAQLVRLVAGREISTRIRDKGFLVSSAVLIVLIIGLMLFQVLLGGGESTSRIGLVGGDRTVEQVLQQQGEALGTEVTVVELADEAAARTAVAEEDVDAALLDPTGSRPELLVQSAGGSTEDLVQSALAALSVADQLTEAGVQLEPAPAVDVVALEADEEDRTQATVVALLGVGLLYFLFILFGQFVAQGVVEEKSSRVVELLLATMRPWQLLAGKIIGLGALGLLQTAVIAVVGVAGALAFDVIDLPGQLIGTVLNVLAWFVIGYAFYAAVFAVAASLVSRQEDLGSVLTPTTILLVVGFIVAVQAAQDPGSTLATVTSYVPGLSPMVMPVRQAAGEAAWWEVGLAVLLMVLAIAVIVRIGGRIYSGALLRTGGRLKLREALAAEKA
ncbi:ABC transporter permease [Modestobacter sp. VKM Ac-2979]|uniref:ABC transporter permease n=1 Tax=unclassified Modestobacter TaxID=2643866 RepID=UPI0022AB772E|nr:MULTISPECIES: ABC transporter permease [unclassified Modestobacter]MCZ2810549.1 ABC transporter permease [Modestobacter sp. VKM Ac-2979]MCZ2842035.1 ABC transporter permease [Modestobacter sp. VKM Ac-2980]